MENTKTLRTDCRTRSKGLLAGLALCALLVMPACDREPPEEALRTQLRDMQSAVADGRMDDFMEGVAVDFSGNQGMDRAALHNLLRLQALASPHISATTAPLQVRMQGDHAEVRFDAILAGGSRRLLPDNAQTYSITSGWRIEQGEWRVYYAQWEPLH